MSKKNKKVFKQQIKQMLSEIDKVGTSPKLSTSVTTKAVSPVVTIPQAVSSNLSIAPVSIVKSDFKKIILLFSIMIVILVAAAFISDKTSYLSIFADKLYNWARLGS